MEREREIKGRGGGEDGLLKKLLFTLSSGRLEGKFRSLTFGNSGSSVPSLERGEYATVCLVTSFFPVSFTQAAPFFEYITS